MNRPSSSVEQAAFQSDDVYLARAATVLNDVGAELRHVTDVLDMRRILRERDDDIRYTLENYADDTHPRTPESVNVMCGCKGWPLVACSWHTYVAAELSEAS